MADNDSKDNWWLDDIYDSVMINAKEDMRQ